MKLLILFLAILGLTLTTEAVPTKLQVKPSNSVNANDLRYLVNRLLENIDLINLDRVLNEIFQTDQGAIFLLYLRGAGFGRILDTFEAEAEVQNILNYIEQNGIEDIREFLAKVLSDLGISRPTLSPRVVDIAPNATFEELLEQLGTCFDAEGLKETALDLINTEQAAFDFLNYLARVEVGEAWQRIKVQKDFVSLLNLLGSAGLDVDAIIDQLESIMGWGVTY